MTAPLHAVKRPHLLVVLGAGLMLGVLSPSSAGAQAEIIDSPMYRMPDVPIPPVEIVFPGGLQELWLRALARPEVEMRLRAAQTIGLAHQRGMKGLEATITPLTVALEAADERPAVRLAAAQALIALDARQAAPNLLAQAQAAEDDAAFREAVEPALARWDYRPARAMWLARLEAPASAARSFLLAIRGLGMVREDKAVPGLRALVAAEQVPGPTRLEAARALGAIRQGGLEKDAEALVLAPGPRGLVGRLAAAHLLHRHTSPAALATLARLARDPEPAVTALAVERLIEIDPKLAVPMLEHLLGSPAVDVRTLGAQVLFRLPTKEHLALLSGLLQDGHPEVRTKAREHLLKLAEQKEFRQQIVDEGTRVLAGQDWRGLEQAAILLAQLGHGPAGPRLVDLLSAERSEVFVTAAWALRKLAVPETLEPVRKYVEAEVGRMLAGKATPGPKDAAGMGAHQLSQLIQLLGLQKYEPAVPQLRQFVPKRHVLGWETRAAAIWALGLIHEGKLVPALAADIEQRLNDNAPLDAENVRVRWMAAVTLGRMRAAKALPSLKTYWSGRLTADRLCNACGWAIQEITGTPLPAALPTRELQQNWFLVPQL